MYKVVYNSCYGGFGLSRKACKRLLELGYVPPANEYITSEADRCWMYLFSKIERHNPLLVQVVEELQSEANGDCSRLSIEEIPVPCYNISEFDGKEIVEFPYDYTFIIT